MWPHQFRASAVFALLPQLQSFAGATTVEQAMSEHICKSKWQLDVFDCAREETLGNFFRGTAGQGHARTQKKRTSVKFDRHVKTM